MRILNSIWRPCLLEHSASRSFVVPYPLLPHRVVPMGFPMTGLLRSGQAMGLSVDGAEGGATKRTLGWKQCPLDDCVHGGTRYWQCRLDFRIPLPLPLMPLVTWPQRWFQLAVDRLGTSDNDSQIGHPTAFAFALTLVAGPPTIFVVAVLLAFTDAIWSPD